MDIRHGLLAGMILALTACGGGSASTAPTVPVIKAPAVSNLVAFMGDSITYGWNLANFDSNPTMNLGIPGEITSKMLARFGDVVAANPGIVVILGGTNDIADGQTPEWTIANLKSMADMARAAGIKVILCSVMATVGSKVPVPWSDEPAIPVLNAKILELARQEGYLYADYYDVMLLPDGTADPTLLLDGLHPNAAGYTVMWRVVAPLIAEYLH
jgi:lysophospholipase L1-like esterase